MEKLKCFNFSPSVFHRHLMDETPQKLSYDDGDLSRWQGRLRRKMKQLIGDFHTKKTPLNVQTLWKREYPLGEIQKIVFRSEPYSDVPAYVCIPENAAPPYDFMICLQGHSTGMHNSIAVDINDEKKKIKVANDRDFALGCMKRGIAALCIEQRAFGEREEKVQAQVSTRRCHDAAMQALMLGKTLIGERIFDIERGIDYLETRQDVNFKTLGVMGNSAGGTASVYAAAMLPRIKLAMPSCSFGTYRESKMSVPHCGCGYIPGIMLYADMPDVLGLFAPRPVIIVAGRNDEVVPFISVRKGFRRLKTIYRAAGAENKCRLLTGSEGHRFYADLAWPYALEEMKKIKENSPDFFRNSPQRVADPDK